MFRLTRRVTFNNSSWSAQSLTLTSLLDANRPLPLFCTFFFFFFSTVLPKKPKPATSSLLTASSLCTRVCVVLPSRLIILDKQCFKLSLYSCCSCRGDRSRSCFYVFVCSSVSVYATTLQLWRIPRSASRGIPATKNVLTILSVNCSLQVNVISSNVSLKER